MSALLFDIGRSKVRVAFSSNFEDFEEPRVFGTPVDFSEGIKEISETARSVAKGRDFEKIVGGMSRSIPGWSTERVKESFASTFGKEPIIENDAAIAGLGEAVYGAGKGFDIVAYVTVSTGVGGARIVGRQIDDRAVGFEPGKQIIDIEEGVVRTLEDLISGKALEFVEGKNPKDVSDQNVWQRLAEYLAVGLNNIIVEWSPECVVLGGSMITGDPAIPIDRAESRLHEILKIFPAVPPIKKAELGDFGGLWGALWYSKT
jgi:predicted NBD/HSP70 family sugar kinase